MQFAPRAMGHLEWLIWRVHHHNPSEFCRELDKLGSITSSVIRLRHPLWSVLPAVSPIPG